MLNFWNFKILQNLWNLKKFLNWRLDQVLIPIWANAEDGIADDVDDNNADNDAADDANADIVDYVADDVDGDYNDDYNADDNAAAEFELQ